MICIDNGIIKPEPTQEEVLKRALDEIQETRKINEKLVAMIESMKQAPTANRVSKESKDSRESKDSKESREAK